MTNDPKRVHRFYKPGADEAQQAETQRTNQMITSRTIAALDRQAKGLRAAAAAEQEAAERLNVEGSRASAWAAAACAMEFRRQATEVENDIEEAVGQLEEDMDVMAGRVAEALADMAYRSGSGIEDAIDAVRSGAERELQRAVAMEIQHHIHIEQAEAANEGETSTEQWIDAR